MLLLRTTVLACVAVALALGVASPPAVGETLSEAMAAAYHYNPRLDAARATLRATDEEVPRAKAGFLPNVSATGTTGYQKTTSRPNDPSIDAQTRPKSVGVSATQSIFSGFRTVSAVGEAEAAVRAERETLRSVEQGVLLDTVTAYMDVLRDQTIEHLRSDNVDRLTKELGNTRARLAQGQVTRTDLEQSILRRAGAISQLNAARAQLHTSRASYERLVGRPPSRLAPPSLAKWPIPKSLDEALAISYREHPNVVFALYQEQQARHTIDRIRGELLPSAHIQASVQRQYEPNPFDKREDTTAVIGQLSVPLYTGGEVEARVRQAKQTHVARLQQIEQSRTEVQAGAVQTWAQLTAAREQLEYDELQASSARAALDGVRKEERFAQRTVLDVLNAELEFLNAEINLAATRHNLVVGSFAVLAAVGRLNVAEIGVGQAAYDPDIHYQEVKRKWWGLSITYPDGRSETMDVQPSHDDKVDDHRPAPFSKPNR